MRFSVINLIKNLFSRRKQVKSKSFKEQMLRSNRLPSSKRDIRVGYSRF